MHRTLKAETATPPERKRNSGRSIVFGEATLLAVNRKRDQDVAHSQRNMLPTAAEKANRAGVNSIVSKESPHELAEDVDIWSQPNRSDPTRRQSKT